MALYIEHAKTYIVIWAAFFFFHFKKFLRCDITLNTAAANEQQSLCQLPVSHQSYDLNVMLFRDEHKQSGVLKKLQEALLSHNASLCTAAGQQSSELFQINQRLEQEISSLPFNKVIQHVTEDVYCATVWFEGIWVYLFGIYRSEGSIIVLLCTTVVFSGRHLSDFQFEEFKRMYSFRKHFNQPQ